MKDRYVYSTQRSTILTFGRSGVSPPRNTPLLTRRSIPHPATPCDILRLTRQEAPLLAGFFILLNLADNPRKPPAIPPESRPGRSCPEWRSRSARSRLSG